ncbi:hypothetical protein Cha6605_2316 [Chamaesiphon minutus PCC 6605]|uniref:Uncharacterized protein n=1 Tax=Chamaesiphon minutus (strain ATCC 27169 / PCC 6605) TaxID=1173020 RepID=K9UE59_CHAP6|nr:hypothetical protein Cha6605_2316 [Chamaesiphon minutus PCC 6605]
MRHRVVFGICRGGFMQANIDVTVRYQTKPTLLHQNLKRSQMGSIKRGLMKNPLLGGVPVGRGG